MAQNDDAFFFENKSDFESDSLTLHILNLERPECGGEEARRVGNNCTSYRIRRGDLLHKELLN